MGDTDLRSRVLPRKWMTCQTYYLGSSLLATGLRTPFNAYERHFREVAVEARLLEL
jgi:hypothetical protein